MSASPPVVPVPRCAVNVRPAVAGDYAFVDRLQDVHGKALGFMRRAALEGKIKLGEVLIADDEMRLPIGYCIASYRYLKRDELGVVYQMNVAPGAQRKLVGATLLKAVFERAPYGCKLFCCWCAQDLDANYFWESLGFMPLAFRTGASGKRTHIFWQRRIREGDTTTPYWYPAKTDGGMMREDRIVLPIPPGVHWKDPMPMLIPQAQHALPAQPAPPAPPAPVKNAHVSAAAAEAIPAASTPAASTPAASTPAASKPQVKRRVQFGPPSDAPEAVVEKVKLGKPAKPKRAKTKADPRHVAKARELRDRYLEQLNAGLALPQGGQEKYAVGRELAAPPTQAPPLLLPAA